MLANFLLGVALYGSVYILPVYLACVQGYNSEQIGEVLAWTGFPQLLLIPLVPQLMKRVDPRIVIGVAFALFAASNFMNIYVTNDYAADQLFWPNIIRAFGQALCFAPLSAIAGRSDARHGQMIQPHIGGVCTAIELVDDRGADYGNLDVLALRIISTAYSRLL